MIRGLLLDLEGVLYESGHTIAGAADAVRELADAGLRIRYLTNTTTRSRRAIVERLRSMGIFHRPTAGGRRVGLCGDTDHLEVDGQICRHGCVLKGTLTSV